MADRHRPDDLARLRALVTAQQARLDRLERRRIPRLLPALLVALLLAVAPAGLLADDRFGDVPAGNPHHDDIALIAAAGITRGCNPPANTCDGYYAHPCPE